MSDDELAGIISGFDPDPEITRAIDLLSAVEIQSLIDNPFSTREQLFAFVAGRTQAPDAIQHPR